MNIWAHTDTDTFDHGEMDSRKKEKNICWNAHVKCHWNWNVFVLLVFFMLLAALLIYFASSWALHFSLFRFFSLIPVDCFSFVDLTQKGARFKQINYTYSCESVCFQQLRIKLSQTLSMIRANIPCNFVNQEETGREEKQILLLLLKIFGRVEF